MKKNTIIKPTTMIWNDIKIVKISDVGDKFYKWLYGQTLPLVEEDENPTGWAYYWDYERFINNLPVID